MKIHYRISILTVSLIMITGFIVIIINSNLFGNILETNLVEREKMELVAIEKTITPYISEKDPLYITDFLLEQKEIKKDIVEYIVLYDSANNIIAHTFPAGVPKEVLQLQAPEQGALFGVIENNLDGRNFIDVVHPVDEGTRIVGYIHVGYKKTYIENIVSQIVTFLIFVVILISLFTGFLGFFVSDIITRPIEDLSEGMQEISKGNLDIELDIRTADELEILGRAFNKMAKDLKESQQKLRNYGREMESRVKARTSELNKKMVEMQKAKEAVLNMMKDTDALNKNLMEAQQKLKQNLDVLKETDIKKSQFMSVAAHELKTPLTSINGFTQILRNKDVGKNPNKREKYLKIIEDETSRLVKIVNNVLDLSRADMGALNYDISRVDVTSVVDAVKTEMAVQVKEKGLKFECNIGKNLPKIYTDEEHLTEILINLINNAVKYTSKGTITLIVSRERDNLHFVVRDTGIGISEAEQPKIFSRFYQVDFSPTRRAGGLGIGLVLCRKSIEFFGGKIWFESKLGAGTAFHFTLPIKPPLKLQKSQK